MKNIMYILILFILLPSCSRNQGGIIVHREKNMVFVEAKKIVESEGCFKFLLIGYKTKSSNIPIYISDNNFHYCGEKIAFDLPRDILDNKVDMKIYATASFDRTTPNYVYTGEEP